MAPLISTILVQTLLLQTAFSLPKDTVLTASSPSSKYLLGGASRAADQNGNWEYIIVGSGAGGGPLAARLAMAGKRVLLIDAGDDQAAGNNLNVTVPTFHAYSTEDPTLAWDFYVKHYKEEERQKQDSKSAYLTPSGQKYVGYNPPPGSKHLGILYPRAGTIGGCTSHNALVNIYPHRKDWDHIAETTGDNSWNHTNMRRIYEKMENVSYTTVGSPGHGYDGWLGVGRADITMGYNDTKLIGLATSAASEMGELPGPQIPLLSDVLSLPSTLANLGRVIGGDANSGDAGRDQREGVYNIPLAIKGGKRNGSRDFVMQVFNSPNKYPLDIMINTLVTKVNFAAGAAGGKPKATGVSFLNGKSLYRADPRSGNAGPGTPGTATATAEVILSGGAFNTPQLLKLSGVGAKEELAQFNIPVIADLPGVGTNLQDHFEIGVTHRAQDAFAVIANCKYNREQPDVCLEDWKNDNGPYASSNGFIFAIIKKSSVAVQDTVYGNDPDLLMFGGIADFRGYYPGYSNDVYGYANWTWVVLKAHTGNYGPKAGTVKLKSADPRDTPDILFNFFDEGNTDAGADNRDLTAMMEAVGIGREVTSNATTPLAMGPVFREIRPGPEINTDAKIKEHIKQEAWSHHCSCTCPIGADNDPWAVLDSKFRVRGTQGLRVVDASVFPRIPGYFIAVPTYMVGEKAAESILLGE